MSKDIEINPLGTNWHGLVANNVLHVVDHFGPGATPTIHSFSGNRVDGYDYKVVELKINIIQTVSF